MAEYVKNGGTWDKEALQEYADRENVKVSPLINISRFEDGVMYIHDGHHRTLATLLAGRLLLYPTEFKITHWMYEQYLEINFEVGWVTPFDPRTQCRKADLQKFKRYVIREAKESPEKAIKLIKKYKLIYAEPRKIFTVRDLNET